MNSNLKYFLGDTFVYGVAVSLSKAVGLIMFPLLVASLSETQYGLYDYFSVLVTFYVIAITFGLDSGLARYYYNSEDKIYRDGLISTVLLLHLLFYCLQFILSFLIYRYLNNFLNANLEFTFLQINIFFQLFIGFSINLFRWSKERIKFIVVSLGSLVFLACSFVLIKYFYYLNLSSAIFAITVVNGFFFLVCIFLLKDIFNFNRSFVHFKELIVYSIPLGIIGVLSSLITPFERTLILYNFSEFDLTKYSIVYKIGILITLFINAFHSAWGPYVLSRNLSDQNELKFVDSLIKYFLLVIILIGIVISGLSPYFLKYFTDVNIVDMYPLIFLISLVFISRGLGWIFETTQTVYKSSKYILYSTFIYFISTFCFIYLFSQLFGLLGIAIALLFGQLIKIIIDFKMSRRFGQLFPSDRKSLIYLILIISFHVIGVAFINQKNWLIYHLLLFLGSMVFFYLLFGRPKKIIV